MSRSVLSQFKPIVENIFGYDSPTSAECNADNYSKITPHAGWHLKTLTRPLNANDYDSSISFLHPDGIFFALIKTLMTETSAKYEFPVAQFPPCFRAMIESGTVPAFFCQQNNLNELHFDMPSHIRST